ncbi:MAG: T9SS type A sorting domain-containing protein [Bacteroidetes bacterium]|nr:T9SS type A sorting domain-containing protein [Bacteroidota bacterium]
MKKSIIITLCFSLFISVVSAQVPAAWSTLGIGGGGALYSPSINPADHNEIYMACDMSELFHSSDRGGSWAEVNFLKIQGGHDACIQFTSDPNIRYTVDYTSINGMDYIRPMKSTDGGNSWNVLAGNPYPLQPNGGLLRLLADYNNPGHLIIADYGTIWFSNDGGITFHFVHTNISSGAGNHIAGAFFDNQNIYIGTNDGLLLSSNGGQTFSTMSVTGIPSGEYILSFAGAKQSGTLRFLCLTSANVWAGYTYGDNYWNAMKGIYQMDNANGSWSSRISGISIGSDFPVFIGMASNNIDIAYISGGSAAGNPIVMKSTAGGSWSHVFIAVNNQNIYTGWCGSGGDHGWGYAEAPFGFTVAYDDANTVMFTDYGFGHITTDGGTTWAQQYLSPADQNTMNVPTPKEKKYHSSGMENTSCWQIIWTDSLHLFAGYSDINGIMSDDKGQSWKFIPNLTQNTVYCLIKHTNGNSYAATSNVHDIYQSTRIYDAQIDAGTGAVWYSTDNGISFSVLHNFNHPVVWIAIDPSNANRMYASVLHHNKGTIGGIYVTNNLDAGTSSIWTKMTNPPICNGHPDMINVLNNGDLVVSFSARKPTTGSSFTDSSGVCYYNYTSSSWSYRSHTNMRFWTQDVVVDPNDVSQNTWYACVFQGWGTSGINGTGGLYKTTDKGLNWIRIQDDYRVNSCTIRPGNPDEMYMTTETEGLWYSANATAGNPVFTQVANYPFRHPMRVFYNPFKDGEVWVTAFGNGIKLGTDSTSSIIPHFAIFGQIKVTIFPDPFSDWFRVSVVSNPEEKIFHYQLISIDGKVLSEGILTTGTTYRPDQMEIPSGISFLKITDSEGVSGTAKLVRY